MITKNLTINDREGITLMKFGTGDIGVTHVVHDDYTGVAFKNQESRDVGSAENLGKNMTISRFNTEVMMTFDKPESIDVVIEQLQKAKTELEKANEIFNARTS